MGDPFPLPSQVVRIPQRVAAISPSTRIPLPSHAAAAACHEEHRPASHSARRPSCAAPYRGTTPDHSDVNARDLAPRPAANCTPDEIVRPARCPRVAAQWPLRIRPLSRATATWRSVPLRRVDRATARLRRGTLGTLRCRHRRQTLHPATPHQGQVTAAQCTTPSLVPHHSRA